MSLLLLFNQNGAVAVPVITPGDAIVSIPNWGVSYNPPQYSPQRWKPPRYKKPW